MSCRAIHSHLLKCLQCPILPYPTISCFLLLSMYTCQDGSTPTCSHLSLTGKLSLSSVKPQYFGTKLGYRFLGDKKVWGWTHKRYYIETIPHFKDVQSWEPFQVSGVSWLLLENMGKGQTHQLKMCATGSSLFSQSQFQGCMPAEICFSRKHVLGGPLFSDPLERPAWGLQTMRGGQLAGEVEILARVRDQLILKNWNSPRWRLLCSCKF